MARRSKVENVSADVPEGAGFPPRWLLMVIGVVAVAGTIWAIAGEYAGAVFSTFIFGIFVVPVFVAAWMVGLLLTEPFVRRKLFAGSPRPEAYRSLVATALGLGVFALGTLGFGTVHLIEPGGVVWPLAALPLAGMAAGFAATRRFLQGMDRGPLLARTHKGDWLYLPAAVPVAILLIAATFPPGTLWRTEAGGYDVMEYHLEMPREYALNNSTAPVGHNVYSFLPANVEMLYLMMMQVAKGVMGGERAAGYVWGAFPAQFGHALMMLMTAAAIALMPVGPREKPWLHATGRATAVLLFLGVPWTLVTGSLAYNEGGMMLFGTLALGAAFAGGAGRKGSGVLAGIFLGLALGCKMTAGVFFALPVAMIFLVRGVKSSSQLKALGWAVVLAAVVYMPWAIRAAVGSGGNPLFPIAASTLGSKDWTAEQVARFEKGHAAPERISRVDALVENSIFDGQWSVQVMALLKEEEAPATRQGNPPATAESLARDEAHAATAPAPEEPWWRRMGAIWWGLPLAVGCAFISRVGRAEAGMVLGVLVIQVLAWLFATHLQGRFLLPMAVPLALLAGRGVQGLQLSSEGVAVSGMRMAAGTVIVLHALFAGFLLLPEARLFGGLRPRDGAPKSAPIGDAFGQLINVAAIVEQAGGKVEVPPKKVLLVGEARAWRYVGEADYSTVFDGDWFVRYLGDPAAGEKYLRELKVSYVLINWSEVARLRGSYGFEGTMSVAEMKARVKGLGEVGVVRVEGDEGYEVLRVGMK